MRQNHMAMGAGNLLKFMGPMAGSQRKLHDFRVHQCGKQGKDRNSDIH